MKGYWLIQGTAVTDAAAQDDYARLWSPIATRYGARLVRDAASLELKEARDTARLVLVEFPSLAAARACYEDPAYQAACVHALKASRRSLLILEGEIL